MGRRLFGEGRNLIQRLQPCIARTAAVKAAPFLLACLTDLRLDGRASDPREMLVRLNMERSRMRR